ncbi:FAD-dependent thymidylate synthase [Neomoorella thermoacetica]|uniref:FAD-dependent thymidylate synthase n=2 Tax=Neomoorella thermoacetica TaxID=1525 RepID=A0A1D7XEZ7_NEOTH|nr:FAD-dependent thymidylate synthase [Moorella thermoacetica]AKX95343.1 thymidylate synthase ThyX [Moorella thermoacetica]AKX97968.1 thymidylate synthase ThyX [Moorella thermoacetica]AOQ25456.1 Thymidylate synthase ThyX [Moorella thermoacetica]OIQ11369.1 thymidylate synthase ThyX [Moorella thermoacetica]OIQ54042.1 thymidylate synthase ThyX [Moorella thermoacetica]
MIIEQPRVLVPEKALDANLILRLERYARVCYKSEARTGADTAAPFLKKLLERGHESVIEHEKITVLIIADRGISHEIVRHRIGSYSQESTRYCNYSKDSFGNEITVIEPFFFAGREAYNLWEKACRVAEKSYLELLKYSSPQEARSVLPNSLKTELVVTYNLREWRHFFRLRCSSSAHPQMRQIAIPLLLLFRKRLPVLFEDINYDQNFPGKYYARVIITDDFFHEIGREEL